MIIKYYNGYVKKSTLLEMTNTGKNGTTAYHIKKTLISLGFNAKGVSCNLSDINSDNIILPCIANVVIDNKYKHFVVIYEINYKKKYLVIGDPADKVKKITYDEFDKIFNKVLIIFFPTRTLTVDKEISLFNFVVKTLLNHKKILINIFILSIFITLFSILASFYTQYMINGINFYSKFYLIFIFGIFVSIYSFRIFSDYFRNILLLHINQKLNLELTLDIYNKIIKLPYRYYKNRTTGDILSRINDLDNVRETISRIALSLFIDFPLALVSLFVLCFINKTLFKIGLVILVLYIVIIILYKNIFNNYIKEIKQKKGQMTSFMVESISAFETIKGIHIENKIIDSFEKKYVNLLKTSFKYEKAYFFQLLIKELVNNIGYILIILIGCILVIENKISLGLLFTFSSLITYFLEPIKNIINLDSNIKEAKQALRRVLEIVTYEEENCGYLEEIKNGNVKFRKLNFSFNDRDYVLKNINLDIKKGTKVMVVGKSGSGKSTLFKLLMKNYKVKNNHIFIDDIDINDYKKSAINEKIIYISQNELLFNNTLYNNLVYDSSDCLRLNKIADMCYINEIMDSNLGFNTLIEENGFNLSGGEKQRIILSRSLLRNFEILIIDEGLSQVDINLERKILKNIFKNFKDKTIIMVSHRLDNSSLFDSLVKIENGIVKEVKNG